MAEQIPTLEQFLNDIVPTLPQASVIKPENAIRWYNDVKKIDPDRFMWHVARIRGFGGSDIGIIAAWFLNEHALFKTARDIVCEKLMYASPFASNAKMRQGTFMEEHVKQEFLRTNNATSRQDLVALMDKATDPDHPWMRVSVDDIAQIGNTIYVTDYKTPTSEPKNEVPINYAAQVHQGLHLAQKNNVPATGMLVVPYSWADAIPKPVLIEQDINLMQAILEGGDIVWNHVLEGKLPDYKRFESQSVAYSVESCELISKAQSELLVATACFNVASQIKASAEDELQNILKEHAPRYARFKGARLPIDLTAAVNQKVDKDDFEQMLAEQQIKIEDLSCPDSYFDNDKLEDFLEEQGRTVQEFKRLKPDVSKILEFCDARGLTPPIDESMSFSFRKKQIKADLEEATEVATERVESIFVELLGPSKQLDQEVPEESTSPSMS